MVLVLILLLHVVCNNFEKYISTKFELNFFRNKEENRILVNLLEMDFCFHTVVSNFFTKLLSPKVNYFILFCKKCSVVNTLSLNNKSQCWLENTFYKTVVPKS